MPDVDVTLAMADYDRTAALRSGTVKPDGIALRYLISPPSETFWRMLKFNEFEASEMSLSSFLISRVQEDRWTAIPVFPYRGFFHASVMVRADSGIARPEDLAGKRFGLPEYQMTAAVWVRGTLEHDFGVPPSAIRWLIERKPGLSHGGATGFKAPPGVSVEPLEAGDTLEAALLAGRIDAVMTSPYPGMKSRLNATDLLSLARRPELKPLFDDPVAEGRRYFQAHGFSHINHTVIVQNRLLEQHPWIALNLLTAFSRAKDESYGRLDTLLRGNLIGAFGHLLAQRQAFGEDPYPYGLKQNLDALRLLATHVFEQGLISKAPDVESLFAASTRAV